MYKFQSDKPQKRKSLDGFLSSEPRRPHFQPVHSKPVQDTMMRPRMSPLDDFKKPNGFTGQNNPKLASSGAYVAEPAKRPQADDSSSRRGHGAQKHRKKFSFKVFMKVSIFLIISVLAVTGFVFGKAWWNAHKALQGGGGALALNKNIDPYQLKGEGDGRVNILLMGKGGEAHVGGDLTDSIMIASVDPINNGATTLSLPRDLWVKPAGLWPMKINAVYTSAKDQALYQNPKDEAAAETAGIAALEKTVEDYMGVPIHYYAMVDFVAFQDAVNAVGGIEVNLPEAYSDNTMLVGKKYLNLPAGPQQLDGGYALAYARSRYGAERGDFDRGAHQQLIILALKDKALSAGTFANPLKVTQLLDTFGNRVQTNFSINDIMRMYDLSKQLSNANVVAVDLAMPGSAVVTTGNVGDQSVVIPKAGVDDYSEVRAFVRNNLKDGFIIKENPSIIVLNGSSTPGAAQKRADELKGYGYNVIQVADATTKNATTTQLVDMTKGLKKYTKRYLEQRLGTTAVDGIENMDLTPYTADFIVIVGPEG